MRHGALSDMLTDRWSMPSPHVVNWNAGLTYGTFQCIHMREKTNQMAMTGNEPGTYSHVNPKFTSPTIHTATNLASFLTSFLSESISFDIVDLMRAGRPTG